MTGQMLPIGNPTRPDEDIQPIGGERRVRRNFAVRTRRDRTARLWWKAAVRRIRLVQWLMPANSTFWTPDVFFAPRAAFRIMPGNQLTTSEVGWREWPSALAACGNPDLMTMRTRRQVLRHPF